MRRALLALVAVALAGAAIYVALRARSGPLVITGIVTTDDVIVSSQVDGRLARLLVKEGDTVTRGQLLAEIDPRELAADVAYYSSQAGGAHAQVQEAEAALLIERERAEESVRQARSTLASTESQRVEAAATLENARIELDRVQRLTGGGIASAQQLDQARTAYDAARARVDALARTVDAQQAAVALAQAAARQVAVRRSQLQSAEHLDAAAAAQRSKADVRLAYTEVRAPLGGLVDVRAARVGEVISKAQPIVSLIDPDDYWIRIDVEETYLDRAALGTHLRVRLPSGDQRDGVVYYRNADAGFATQRDVSRTKRDIRTFEVRLRTDNRDRHLAVGMTAYVELPVVR